MVQQMSVYTFRVYQIIITKCTNRADSKNLLHCNLDIFETVKEASLSCMFPKYKYKVTMCYVLCVMGFDLQEFFQFFDRQVL